MKMAQIKTWLLACVLVVSIACLNSCKKKEAAIPEQPEQEQQAGDVEVKAPPEYTQAQIDAAKLEKRRLDMAKKPAQQRGDLLDEQEVNPHADKLYQLALFHSKVAKKPGMTSSSYKRMVDYCRQLFEQYPDNVSTPKARVLLRGMPQRYQRQFNVTNEEMGLTN